jgi:hypothetical protein
MQLEVTYLSDYSMCTNWRLFFSCLWSSITSQLDLSPGVHVFAWYLFCMQVKCYSPLSDLSCDVGDWLNLLLVFGNKTRASKPWQAQQLFIFSHLYLMEPICCNKLSQASILHFLRTEIELCNKSQPKVQFWNNRISELWLNVPFIYYFTDLH